MPTVTISLPKELKERLDKHPDINWSEIFRRAFENKVTDLEEFERFKKQRGI
jgi:metal-responsive CopG/Arc/MetJ family transcriptional regulator